MYAAEYRAAAVVDEQEVEVARAVPGLGKLEQLLRVIQWR